jgi:hypothetical protein
MHRRFGMQWLMRGVAVGLMCATSMLAGSPPAAAAGRFHGGFPGFYRGLYPYSLFGYPGYRYGGYFPYSLYEDDGPDCRFVWVKRTVKHKVVQRGIWTCS